MTASVAKTAKGAATRGAVIRAAAGVFGRRGYVAASMNEIVAATGLTKGAVYFHFASKSDLAVAVILDGKDRWLAAASQEAASHSRAIDQLSAVADLVARLAASPDEDVNLVRLTNELAASADGAALPEPAAMLKPWVDFLAEIVRAAQAAGDLDASRSPHDVASVLIAAFEGVKQSLDPTTAQFRRQVTLLREVLLAGLAAPTH